MQGLGFFWNTVYVNIYVTGKKAHTTLEIGDNVIYLNFEYVNLVSSCLFASQTWSTKVRKVDFTALNWLTRLQRRTTDSIDRLDFRRLFRLNSTPTSNDRLGRSTRSISGSTYIVFYEYRSLNFRFTTFLSPTTGERGERVFIPK